MDIVKALVVIVVGGVLVYAAAKEVLGWWRARTRLRRTTAVVVALVEPGATGPGNVSRSPVFRFSTEDDRTVEATSGSWSYPGPKIGSEIPIVYDPAHPEQTAERAGARKVQLVLAPVIALIGLALIGYGISLPG